MTIDWTDRCHVGDCREVLPTLPAQSVQMCCTSPPYWGLRDYGTATWEGGKKGCDHRKILDAVAAVATSTLGGGKKTTGHLQEGYKAKCARCGARRIDAQLGLEATPEEFVANMVEVFREVRRVLADDGTLWLNLGDCYAGSSQTGGSGRETITGGKRNQQETMFAHRRGLGRLKPKDLVGIPWRVAFALQADGWTLRSDCIWHKPNPMPESVTDRPTRAHEYLFLLSKQPKYFYDANAVREPQNGTAHSRGKGVTPKSALAEVRNRSNDSFHAATAAWHDAPDGRRNRRSVWTIPSAPFKDAHFSTFPRKLVEPCVLAGSRPGDIVLDPFLGSGTVAEIAQHLGRRWIGIDLNSDYERMQKRRTAQTSLVLL